MLTQEKLDEIDDKLGEYCAAGYALGLIGEANIRYFERRFPDLVQRQRVYRLGDIATLRHGTADDYTEEQVAELFEIEAELEGLEDYPLVEDTTFDEVYTEEQEYVVEQIAETYGLDVQAVWNAIYEVNAEFEWEQDYAYLIDEQAVLAELGVTQ